MTEEEKSRITPGPCSVTGCSGVQSHAAPDDLIPGGPDIRLCTPHRDFLMASANARAVYCARCGMIMHFVLVTASGERPAKLCDRILFAENCSYCGDEAFPHQVYTIDEYRMRAKPAEAHRRDNRKNGH